jgi:flap endonuclease-1
MTTEEGRVWSELASGYTTTTTSPLEHLSRLTARCRYILNAYEKRGVPPTQKTYNESRMLLSAMGVPCVTSHGPYEGEALASSLVVNGYADFVASEDTV